MFRAGELTSIRVPSAAQEAVRDLCRARADLVDDRRRVRQRLQALLLRHGRVFRDGVTWTKRHQVWLAAQHFDHPAQQATYTHYRAVLAARDAEVAAIEAELLTWFDHEVFAPVTYRLSAYRGIAELSALGLAAEVIDWRRFASARACMGFTGLVPSEYSSGDRAIRGRITRAGPAAVRTALVEAAWHYRHHPAVGRALTRRQNRVGPDTIARSWTAQQRLCRRFRRISSRGKHPNQTVVAVARELAGFLWAEMTT